MATAPLLEAFDLAVGYAGRGQARRIVLEGISARVEAGELICVLGPNGAGKSTLLRTLAGMQAALAGRVEILGRPVGALRPRELARRIGVVLPERIAAGMLSASALVALGRYPHTDWLGRLRQEDEEIVRRALSAVGAAGLAARDVTQLSDGERQKVMIARALAQEPTVMILDEPTAFLDLPGRVEIMALLAKLARQSAGPDGKRSSGGRGVLLSTHDLDLALRSADRIWLLDGGGGMTAGVPEDLVLGGAFQAAFERQSDDAASTAEGWAVRYDAETGSFHIVSEPTATVRLRGQGLAEHWTRRALERSGYEVREDREALAEVEIVEEEGVYRWHLTFGASSATYGQPCAVEAVRHSSIEELLRGLAQLRETGEDDRLASL